MAAFGGWEMPIAYAGGTLKEHRACRRDAVIFDVSHLGTIRVTGSSAFDRLQAILTNDLSRISPRHAQYTHLLADDGSVVDDIIVWWRGEEIFDVMPNASNTSSVLDALGGTDVTDERAVVAIQGPLARQRLERLLPEGTRVSHFEVAEVTWHDASIVVAGTGYTGEDGVEVALPRRSAEAFWDALIDAGLTPAGLGARDTLRLEAGLPLYGHDLGPGITPLQAGLSWVVGWSKPWFRGRDALVAEKASGPARRLRGLITQGRQPLRDGCDVYSNDRVVGVVTSGNFSPSLSKGIALALIEPGLKPGDSVMVRVREAFLPAEVTLTPFLSLPSKPEELSVSAGVAS